MTGYQTIRDQYFLVWSVPETNIPQLGNHIDVSSAEWVYREAGIGGNVDSYYEYLLKAGLYFDDVGYHGYHLVT